MRQNLFDEIVFNYSDGRYFTTINSGKFGLGKEGIDYYIEVLILNNWVSRTANETEEKSR